MAESAKKATIARASRIFERYDGIDVRSVKQITYCALRAVSISQNFPREIASPPPRKRPSGRYAGRLSHATAGPALLRFRRIYRKCCCILVNGKLTTVREGACFEWRVRRFPSFP
jgi:hypothetical protein